MGIFLVLAVVYMPVYTGNYAFWDDYYLFGGEYFTNVAVRILSDVMARPLAAEMISRVGPLLSFEHGNIVRLIHVVSLSVLAFVLFRLLRKNAVSRSNSLLVAVIIFTLPTSQVLAAQVMVGFAVIPAMVVASLAALAALKGTAKTDLRRALLNFYSLSASALLVAALLMYQPAAMFYWVLVAVPLMFAAGHGEVRLPRVFGLYGIPFLAMGIYFIIGLLKTENVPTPSSFYVFGLTREPVEKIKWFISGPLGDALAPWHVFPSVPFAYFSTALIVAGAAASLAMTIREHGAERFKSSAAVILLRSILVLSLVPLSFIPNIVSSGEFAPYRTMIALVPVVVLLLYWAVRELALLLPGRAGNAVLTAALALVALAGSYRAQENVNHYFVHPSTAEVRYIKDALLNSDLKRYESILLIPPEYSRVFPRTRFDEFGAITSTSRAHRVPQMITIIQTIPDSERGGPLTLLFSEKEKFRGADEKTLVIDMTWMYSMYSDGSSAEP
jgi:hypothetical protein